MVISSCLMLMVALSCRSVCAERPGHYEATTRRPHYQPPHHGPHYETTRRPYHQPPQHGPHYQTTRPPYYQPYPTTRRPHYQPPHPGPHYPTTRRPHYPPYPTTRQPHYPSDYVQRLLYKQEEIHALLQKTYDLALYLCKLSQNLFLNRSGTDLVSLPILWPGGVVQWLARWLRST